MDRNLFGREKYSLTICRLAIQGLSLIEGRRECFLTRCFKRNSTGRGEIGRAKPEQIN
ncbi:hypothetical protein [Thalassoglobus polymorphus]|uniref:hypothetical protein n=1 Tax=Thalassoglobus polymorphus TaxID=2527994 RepID=UPI0018D21F08|nr:hypothetical protein [Thalassoglobus polymorphus]